VESVIQYIRVEVIRPNLRLCYSEGEIEGLCRLMCCQASCEPITVFFDGEYFRIIDGEKRWRASKKMGTRSIKAMIVEPHREF
jgi:ParB family chromosome partitioning protein